LTSIDGINVMTAFTVISEIGTDRSRFQDDDHFTSWMGLTPSKDISSGKIVWEGAKESKNHVAVILRTAATSLLESGTHLEPAIAICAGSCPASKAALKAMARYPAVLIYRLLTKGQAWVDRGRRNSSEGRLERELASLHSKATAKGFILVPIAEARQS
jgi:transposase